METTWKKSSGTLLALAAIIALALLLVLRPLRVDSPASSSARALLRLDNALGATVEPVDRAIGPMLHLSPDAGELVVTSVANKGPAADAGIRVGDVIEKIAGRPAAQAKGERPPAAPTPVLINRGGKRAIVAVRLAA